MAYIITAEGVAFLSILPRASIWLQGAFSGDTQLNFHHSQILFRLYMPAVLDLLH